MFTPQQKFVRTLFQPFVTVNIKEFSRVVAVSVKKHLFFTPIYGNRMVSVWRDQHKEIVHQSQKQITETSGLIIRKFARIMEKTGATVANSPYIYPPCPVHVNS